MRNLKRVGYFFPLLPLHQISVFSISSLLRAEFQVVSLISGSVRCCSSRFNTTISGSVVARSAAMFNELTLDVQLSIPTKYLNSKKVINQRSYLATPLLKFLLYQKSSKRHGYYLTVTSFKCTGKGKTHEPFGARTLFPVTFTCRTFKPCAGETMLGVIHSIHEHGAILRCGPIRFIFLSIRKMGEYVNFIPGKKAAFVNNGLSRIEVDVVVRFKVLDVRWVEKHYKTRREFHVLASLEGDCLGPVSHSGSDELDLL